MMHRRGGRCWRTPPATSAPCLSDLCMCAEQQQRDAGAGWAAGKAGAAEVRAREVCRPFAALLLLLCPARVWPLSWKQRSWDGTPEDCSCRLRHAPPLPCLRTPHAPSQVGAHHLSVTIDSLVQATIALFSAITGRMPRFRWGGGGEGASGVHVAGGWGAVVRPRGTCCTPQYPSKPASPFLWLQGARRQPRREPGAAEHPGAAAHGAGLPAGAGAAAGWHADATLCVVSIAVGGQQPGLRTVLAFRLSQVWAPGGTPPHTYCCVGSASDRGQGT